MDSGTAATPPGPAGESAPLVVPIEAVFEQPLTPADRLVIDRVRTLMQLHQFEVHEIQPAGEQIRVVPVAGTVHEIALSYDAAAPDHLRMTLTVESKAARDVVVWTSSLFFQYVHYHVARLATLNGAPLQMDWEAEQDPRSPARVKYWVENGRSLIERLHKTGATRGPASGPRAAEED